MTRESFPSSPHETPDKHGTQGDDRNRTGATVPSLPPVRWMDADTLAEALLRLPLVAFQLGHRSLEDVGTYLHPATPEAQIVHDIVCGLTRKGGLTLPEVLDGWYGGEAGARELLRGITAPTQEAAA